jgi:hypothetical protein
VALPNDNAMGRFRSQAAAKKALAMSEIAQAKR